MSKSDAMYGISRIDDAAHGSHAWRVSLLRHGKRLVRNFTDKRHGGKAMALRAAKRFRDELVAKHPPMTRKEFASIRRRHNQTGITGVYRYGKSYRLADGTERESFYWEATWPTTPGNNQSINFSVNRFGEDVARQLAIRARERGMRDVEGLFWASSRGGREQFVAEELSAKEARRGRVA